MIFYLDASVLVKRYLVESGSAAVAGLLVEAEAAGTSLISRAEVAAAIRKAVRLGAVVQVEAVNALQRFRAHWPYMVRLTIEEETVALADRLAWEHDLRGYDAVHLASALIWQGAVGEPLTLATYDRELWVAAAQAGLDVWPEGLG